VYCSKNKNKRDHMTKAERTLHEKFVELQSRVRVTKDQFNSFGKYSYWTVGDILSEARPIANELGLSIVLSDKIELIGERFYVVATATVADSYATGYGISNTGFARESESKAGMDVAQITGSASSYARKYALAGLLGLDGEKDADATNTHDKKPQQEQRNTPPRDQPREQEKPHAGGGEFKASDKQKNLIKMLVQKTGVDVSPEQIASLTSKQASAWIEKLNAKEKELATKPEQKDIPW
jgi:hypothetical protein